MVVLFQDPPSKHRDLEFKSRKASFINPDLIIPRTKFDILSGMLVSPENKGVNKLTNVVSIRTQSE